MKKFVSSLLALAFVVGMPAAAFADNNGEKESKKMKGDFCANITTKEAKLADKKAEMDKKHEDHDSEMESKKEGKRAERDGKRDEKRGEMESKMNEKYNAAMASDKLSAEQKAALAAAKPVIDAAWAAKNADVDEAIGEYRSEMSKLTAAEKAKMTEAMKAFDTAAKAAIEKAKADCASGVASKTVAATFKADMEAAHTTLKAVRDTLGLKNPEVKAMRDAEKETRKTETEAARKGFRGFWKGLFGKKDKAPKVEVVDATASTTTATTAVEVK